MAAPGPTRETVRRCREAQWTLTLRAGIHPKAVSERLGHATVPITLDTYSHAIPAMQEETAEKIAGPLLG